MKKLFFLLLTIFFFTQHSTVLASGLTTDTASNNGQVLVRNQDGTMYLTTETVGGNESTYSAERTFSVNKTPISPPTGFAQSIGQLINSVLSAVMVLCALLVFLYLVWGALAWITSGGDKGKTDSARNKITAAVIGLIIVSASYAVLTLVVRFLGFDNLNDVLDNAQTINGPVATQSGTLQ